MLRLGAAAVFSVAGAAYLVASRLLGRDPAGHVAATGTTTTRPVRRSSRVTTTSVTASPTTDSRATRAPATSTTAGAAAEPETPSSTSPPAPGPMEPAGGRVLLCREAWGAAAPTRAMPRHRIQRLTVHHTAAVLTDNREAPQRVRNFQAFHQRNGFADLAYHYVVDARGNVYEGRDVGTPGESFTDYEPTGHFLVVLDGHFDRQPVPSAQMDALVDVLAWGATSFGVSPATIAGHRDYAATSCPGASLYPAVSDGTLRARVESRLASGGISLPRLCGAEGQAHVRAIESGAT
jgi:N-acetylmuramoyl-L-alanine amidase-like protein